MGKANCINYKLLFTELKKINKLFRYGHFCKTFPIQTYGRKFFQGQFSPKFKKITKNLSPPMFLKQFTSNFQEMFLAIFRKICSKQFKKKEKFYDRHKKKK